MVPVKNYLKEIKMKMFLTSAVVFALISSAAVADNTFAPGSNAGSMINQINNNQVQPTPKNLTTLINEVNNEDQRLVEGKFDAATGTLKLYTKDMVAGNDGNDSRREVVVTGFEGMKGDTGATGASAYEVAVQNGFEGTEEEWLASLEGEKGDTGEQGVAGADGKDGRDGVDGKDGRDGVDGKDADTAAIEAQAAAAQDEMNQRLRDMEERAMQNDAAIAGLGGLELRQGGEGVTSWSLGLGGISNDGYTEGAIAAGIHYGIADDMGVYGKISKSFDGGAVAGFIGIEGQF
jgi:hypothetical protein